LVALALVIGIVFTNTSPGIVYSQGKNPVLEQAQKSLEAKFGSAPANSPEFSIAHEIYGVSTVKDVWFTWLIISSENEVSVNLRYVGDGKTPPVPYQR
jgi:hypothetical protein